MVSLPLYGAAHHISQQQSEVPSVLRVSCTAGRPAGRPKAIRVAVLRSSWLDHIPPSSSWPPRAPVFGRPSVGLPISIGLFTLRLAGA